MAVKIAVFVQDKFRNDPAATMLHVIVFERGSTSWNEMDEFYVNILPGAAVASVRRDLTALIDRLADCRIAAGPEFSGVLYRELDSRGFSIFEVDEFSPVTLDGILADLEEDGAADGPDVPTYPVETEMPGVYRLDLIKLQAAYPEMTSKQVLREFLESATFYELHLTCSHVPPWLENGPYDVVTADEGKRLAATIRKKQCGGGA